MLTNIISGPRAWNSDSLDDPKEWYFSVSADLLAALERTVQEMAKHPAAVTPLNVKDFPCGSLGPSLRPVQAALETGRGFVIIEGIPHGRYSTEEMQAMFWLLGQ